MCVKYSLQGWSAHLQMGTSEEQFRFRAVLDHSIKK